MRHERLKKYEPTHNRNLRFPGAKQWKDGAYKEWTMDDYIREFERLNALVPTK